MSDNLEKLFKTALKEATVEPPARVWMQIDSRLAVKNNRIRRVVLYGGIAATIALLLSSLYFLQQQEPILSDFPKVAVQNLELNKPETPATPEILAILTPGSATSPVAKEASRANSTVYSDIQAPCSVTLFVDQKPLSAKHPVGELKESPLRADFIPLINKEALDNHKQYAKLLNEPSTPVRKKINLKYAIGGYISPGYSSGSYHMDNKQSRIVAYTDDQISGIFNLSGGITFAVTPGKRIAIETGVGYTRVGQKTSDSRVFVPRSSSMLTNSSINQVLTPLGSVRSKAKATVFTASNNQFLRSSDETTGTIEQEFDAIQIPLALRYYLNNNKIKFSILGGVGANIMVRNMTYLRYEGIKEKMGETDNIRRFNVSTLVGIGVEYPISKSIHLKIEPGFRYYLQSLSKDPDIDFKPYSFTFSTGFGIRF